MTTLSPRPTPKSSATLFSTAAWIVIPPTASVMTSYDAQEPAVRIDLSSKSDELIKTERDEADAFKPPGCFSAINKVGDP